MMQEAEVLWMMQEAEVLWMMQEAARRQVLKDSCPLARKQARQQARQHPAALLPLSHFG